MTDRQRPQLKPHQQAELIKLQGELELYAARNPISDTSGHSPSRSGTPSPAPDPSNVFAILGARGAGKSTLLAELYSTWRAGGSPRQELEILPPLDCSAIPTEIAQGMAVLIHLRDHLKARPDAPACLKRLIECDAASVHGQRSGDDRVCLTDLIGRYSRTEPGYRDLCLDLSTTASDYSEHLVDGVSERLEMRQKLTTWLGNVLGCLKRRAFVVLLDDFDLVPAEGLFRSLLSFLDELHQPRLLFVLTADFYRLQHLSWDAKTGFDDKTGRALIEKLLPSRNQIDLRQWPGGSRREFKPFQLGRNATTEGLAVGDSPTLGELLGQRTGQRYGRLALLAALLPPLPRGLENLYWSLTAREVPEEPTGDALAPILELLATCRGEPLLARYIKDAGPEEIVETLDFPDHGLSTEEWQSLVAAARRRGEAGRALVALPALHPGVRARRHSRARTSDPSDLDQRIALVLDEVIETAETQWGTRDPLRHDRLQRLPLRDAAEQEVPLWTELLLDIACERVPRTRVSFLAAWRPAAERIADTCFRIDTSRRHLRELLDDDGALSQQASLYWLAPGPHGKHQVRIGWRPLLDALRGVREPLSFCLLADLRIDAGDLCGDLPTHSAADLLPRETWALILLVDGLHRCPWAAFSMPLGWGLATYLGLAAALVRSAYVYGLCESTRWRKTDLSREQRALRAVIAHQHPGNLLRLTEESVVGGLVRLFRDDLSTRVETRCALTKDPLEMALDCYLKSPVYLGVVALTERRAGAWRLCIDQPSAADAWDCTAADGPSSKDLEASDCGTPVGDAG